MHFWVINLRSSIIIAMYDFQKLRTTYKFDVALKLTTELTSDQHLRPIILQKRLAAQTEKRLKWNLDLTEVPL